MTIREIESIVQTLRVRHPDLDEEMLRLLLRAGGWEESPIKDAISIFARYERSKSVQPQKIVLTPLEEERVAQNKVIKTVDFVNHNDNLIVSGGAEPEVKLPEVENVDLLPEMIHSDHMLEEPVKEGVKASTPMLEEKKKEEASFPVEKRDTQPAPPSSASVTTVPPVTVKPVELGTEDMVYLASDGSVVEDVPTLPPVVEEVREKKVVPQASPVIGLEKKDPYTLPPIQQDVKATERKVPEPQSLISHEITPQVKVSSSVIPENLPLRPFESAPHVIPFSQYKEDFHKEESPQPASLSGGLVHVQHGDLQETELVEVKKVPFTKGDEGVAILASIMLLIIMLLLGYMYGNGRL